MSEILKSYTIGFILALVLTIVPFALVATRILAPTMTFFIIAAFALLQVLVHLRFFLHLNLRTSPRENLVALCFAVVLILIMMGGSLWIMLDLHHRMTPA